MNNINESVAKELLEVQRTLGWMDLVIGSIDDAVYVTDEDSRIVFANQYFSDILKVPRVFLLGNKVSDVFNVILDSKLTSELIDSKDKISEDAEIFNWKVSNKKIIFKISKKYIPTTRQVVYLAKDITHEQELSNMKNSFINLASHQLRTPMTSIMLHSHMLNDLYEAENVTPRQKEVALTISRSADRMIRLISDILNITKIQNESLYKTNFEDVDIAEIATVIHGEHKDQLATKSLSFSVDIPKSVPPFKCDRSAVHEILSNLVTNAVQYTPEHGSIAVAVNFDGSFVSISVKDTGIGIPLKAINLIYDQFARADNAFETFNEGTGLGLYLVKLLLMKIDGTIDCKSKVNVGTTFKVKIPYVQ